MRGTVAKWLFCFSIQVLLKAFFVCSMNREPTTAISYKLWAGRTQLWPSMGWVASAGCRRRWAFPASTQGPGTWELCPLGRHFFQTPCSEVGVQAQLPAGGELQKHLIFRTHEMKLHFSKKNLRSVMPVLVCSETRGILNILSTAMLPCLVTSFISFCLVMLIMPSVMCWLFYLW